MRKILIAIVACCLFINTVKTSNQLDCSEYSIETNMNQSSANKRLLEEDSWMAYFYNMLRFCLKVSPLAVNDETKKLFACVLSELPSLVPNVCDLSRDTLQEATAWLKLSDKERFHHSFPAVKCQASGASQAVYLIKGNVGRGFYFDLYDVYVVHWMSHIQHGTTAHFIDAIVKKVLFV